MEIWSSMFSVDAMIVEGRRLGCSRVSEFGRRGKSEILEREEG